MDKLDSGTFPEPNLNPLSNPLLGQHMGRWAEVYFTTPPEKRQEAVQELLRELAADSKAERATTENSEPGETPDPVMESCSSSEVAPLSVVCRQCGEESPASQKYCGSCGAVLLDRTQLPSSVSPAWALQTADGSSQEAPFAPYASSILRPRLNPSLSASDDEEDFRPVAGDALRFIPEYEPVHYRYRLYLGAALAVLIGLLVFVAWRNNAVSSDGTAQGVHHANRAVAPPRQSPAAPPLAANRAPVAGEPAVPGTGGDGSDELAVAQGYLNGRHGAPRDSTEAVRWLWRSVGKQNATATLLLSDFYLRGDGVAKSCDQARLLLDAAARKGKAGAGERLRNLQAFGCQ